MIETITEALQRIAQILDLDVDRSTMCAFSAGSSDGLPYLVLAIECAEEDGTGCGEDLWTITVMVSAGEPTGEMRPGDLGAFIGRMTHLAHLQAVAIGMIGGRCWESPD